MIGDLNSVFRIYSLYTSDEKKKKQNKGKSEPGSRRRHFILSYGIFLRLTHRDDTFFLFGDAALLREREATSADDKTRKHTQTHQTDKNWCNGRLAFSGCCTYRRARCQERKLGYRGARSSVYALSYARQTI